jgi:hypothetical protein
MAPTSRPKPPKQDEVIKAKRIVANKAKKKIQPKNTTRIAGIKTPSQSKGQKMSNKMLSDAEKSGFIKVTKKATLNEMTGKSTGTKYTVTPKGAKYLKDKDKAYSKDPMKLRPKLVSEKTVRQRRNELSKNA